MKADDKLKIFENLLAKHGIENVLREYGKAMSSLNGLQTYQELNQPMPEINSGMNAGGTISANPMEDTTQQPAMPNQLMGV